MAAGQVHIWRASIEAARGDLKRLGSALSAGEHARAVSYANAEARERFLIGRGILRQLLSRYMSTPPAQIRIITEENGKPCLTAENSILSFNVSHSGDVLLFAFTEHQHIGVDVEQERPLRAFAALAEQLLPPEDWLSLHTMPAEQQQRLFFRWWTRHEAELKLGNVAENPWVGNLDVPQGYAAALALPKAPTEILYFEKKFDNGKQES